MDAQPPSVSQTVVHGTLGGQPPSWVFAGLLLVVAFLLGGVAVGQWYVSSRMDKAAIEMRIIEEHMQNTNAILLRRGVLQPGDIQHPTDGSSP